MSTETLLKQSLQIYVEQLRNIEQRCSGHTNIDQPTLEALTAVTEEFLCVCGEFEQNHDQQEIEQARALVLTCTKPWYSQCYFFNRLAFGRGAIPVTSRRWRASTMVRRLPVRELACTWTSLHRSGSLLPHVGDVPSW